MIKRLLQVIALIAFMAPVSLAARQADEQADTIIPYVWGSQKLNGPVWGIALSDVDADGLMDVVLLRRNSVEICAVEGSELKVKKTYSWDKLVEGVRLFTMNLDDDAAEEIIVSAIEEGRPASFAIKLDGDRFRTVFDHSPWHLRVLESEEMSKGKMLIGQQLNSQDFFNGPVFEMTLNGGKLKRGGRLELPARTAIYEFAVLPPGAGDSQQGAQNSPLMISRIMRLDGNEPLKLFERRGKKFKRVWKSNDRYDGSVNIVDAVEREVLGIATDFETVHREPQVVTTRDGFLLSAIMHDVPLKGVVGKRPIVHDGRIVFLKEDPSLGFMKSVETKEVPGYIADYAVRPEEIPISEIKKGKHKETVSVTTATINRLYVIVQLNPSMFEESQQSALLMYEMEN